VELETPEAKFDDLLSNYDQYVELITAKGFKQVAHTNGTNGNGKPKKALIRTNGLTCPCGARLFDNRAKKADGSYKATSPDFSCSDQNCTAGPGGKRLALWPGQYELTT
jgi:hypothetical protein